MAGDLQALVIHLAPGAAPIDAAFAFGSVWIANHHSDNVLRLDPETGQQEALIAIGTYSGPAWFAVTDDAVWVTRQNGKGMARIDPVTNEVAADQIGELAPCGAPATAMGAVWYSACDDALMVRIDASTSEVTTIAADGISWPLAVDGSLYGSGPDGIVRLDPATMTWTATGGCCGDPVGYGGGTLWLASEEALTRVDPASGAVVGTAQLGSVTSVAVTLGAAWATVDGESNLEEIDLDTNGLVEHGPLHSYLSRILAVGDALWITDFGSSEVWRVTVPD